MLRGPLLVTFFAVNLLLPYLPPFSLGICVQLLALAVGSMLVLWDSANFLKEQLRRSLNRNLDLIVLDDFLRALFDPEIGLIASTIGCFVGNAAMYVLPMSNKQRTRLLQSCVFYGQSNDPDTHEMANRVLHTAGGCKFLLPESFQSWLNEEQYVSSTVNNNLTPSKSHLVGSEGSVDTGLSSEDSDDDPVDGQGKFTTNRNNAVVISRSVSDICSEAVVTRTDEVNDERPTEDPLQVALSIFMELLKAKVRRIAKSIPDSSLETVGISSAIIVMTHLGLSSAHVPKVIWFSSGSR